MKTELLFALLEFLNRALVVALGALIAMLCTVYVLFSFLDEIARISICR